MQVFLRKSVCQNISSTLYSVSLLVELTPYNYILFSSNVYLDFYFELHMKDKRYLAMRVKEIYE